MKETSYAFAVARVRANENSLLKPQDIERMIAAPDAQSAMRILNDKGYSDAGAWGLMQEIAPDLAELKFLIVKNDFHNLKAALKALMTDADVAKYFVTPSIVPPEKIKDAVERRSFSELPEFMEEHAAAAYELLTRTMDGQLADILLDAAALKAMQQMASGNTFTLRLAQLVCLTSDLNIALRCAHTGRDAAFVRNALCPCTMVNIEGLSRAAARGEEQLLQYLEENGFAQAAEQMHISVSAFEKWCDDLLVAHVLEARYKSFGIEPLVAYYIAREAEIKSVRIILSCKQNHIPAEKIEERVRRLYV